MSSNNIKRSYGPHGSCIISYNVLLGYPVRWAVREEPGHPQDSGWTFLTEMDTTEYLSNDGSTTTISFDVFAKIEPAVKLIYDYPVGTDVTLVYIDGKARFYDNTTKEQII